MSAGRSSPSPNSPGRTRRLSSRRRSSISAPDPWGKFEESERGIASVLHIIKAPLPVEDTNDKSHRRRSQHGHIVSRVPSPGDNNRISFVTNSGGFRPSSPSLDTGHRRNTSTSYSPHVELTPAQIYGIAQQCSHPTDRPTTPGPPSPVHFITLPDGQYLPFYDRPSEVRELMSVSSTRRLFLLLAQTFPIECTKGKEDDPTTWNYTQLDSWLTEVTREEASDAEWVQQAKLCIANKSELIWERIKAALGVPPELDGAHEDIIGPGMPEGEDAEAVDLEDEIYIEPIILTPTASPVKGFFSSSTFPSDLNRPSLENISEDGPDPDERPTSPTVHGLRVVNCPSPPPTRRFSIPRYHPLSQPHEPYDAAAERGPGRPLFPSNFAHLTLVPTLKAKYVIYISTEDHIGLISSFLYLK